ncbi:protein hypothetical protein [Limosa lapponica baueri]|uniref:CLASP N-terminal domain-containing protein n=1 Tax=Limosa lapponica baueri TaxID=1758121 RepID=A0A2I0T2Z3_LIMLA|nr:protein hypothetical protein [Limosa lapponica baueri]
MDTQLDCRVQTQLLSGSADRHSSPLGTVRRENALVAARERKAEGLLSIRRLAICHSEELLCRLHDVSLAVTKEVNNLRSKVSRSAISTLGELFKTTKKHMDHEVDEVTRVLLQKMGDSNEFIQKGTDRSLEIMVGSVTPTRATTALMASGVPFGDKKVE